MNKIPSQFWDRSRQLEKLCYIERTKNTLLRTQVRLGTYDLELYTKNKGEYTWMKTPIEAFGQLEPPKYNPKVTTPEGRTAKRPANSPPSDNSSKIQKMHTLSNDSTDDI